MTHKIMEMDKKSLREFGIITGSIVAVLFGLLLPWLFGFNYPLWPWYVLAVLAGVALVIPMALNPVYKVWMRFGLVMAWINTRIILGVVFYFVFAPVAVLLKLLGKDPMRRKLDAKIQSYRITSKHNPSNQMEKPF